MRLMTVHDLPTPPPDKTGWPWTEALSLCPPTLPNGSAWPKVTIVTPSFNQVQFLEEAIRSVLLQGYPNLEYMVLDGGSTDGSVDVIQKYASWLDYWVSERDRGQSHALNKGFARATGEWLGWLNSDDGYAPGALYHLMRCAMANQATFAAGASIRFRNGEMHRPMRLQPLPDAFTPSTLRRTQAFDQPACLWRAELFYQAGPLDEDQHYVFDWQFFTRCALLAQVVIIEATTACYRIHGAHKSGAGGQKRWNEVLAVYEQTLTGDERAAFLRVRPWLRMIRWLKRIRHRYPRLYWVCHMPLLAIYYLVVNRRPSLHTDIIRLLELPYPAESQAVQFARGKLCDGTLAGALAGFPCTDG